MASSTHINDQTPPPTHQSSQQGSENWFQSSTPTTESDEEHSEKEDMDTANPSPSGTPTQQTQGTTGAPPTLGDIQAMIQAAVEEAQRKAREEHQQALDRATQQHQLETQALRAELHQGTQSLRQDIFTQVQQTAEQHKQQTEALCRTWEQREQERKRAEDQRHAEMLQEQATNRAKMEEQARKTQANLEDQQSKTEALLQAVLRHLQDSKLAEERTPRITLVNTPPVTTPPPTAARSTHPIDFQWNTPPTLLPIQWIRTQADYRARALEQILAGQTTATADFLTAFKAIRLRPPRLDDLPHWQVMDLNPNPASIDFDTVYLPILLSIAIRMATLGHPPVPADPLWSANLARYETHQGHYDDLRSRLHHPPQDRSEQQFRSNFQATHGREPTQDDAPTWHRILLTEDIIVTRPLTQEEYIQAARAHMLRPIISTPPAATTEPEPTSPHGPSITPEAYTPLSSPPRGTGPTPPAMQTVQPSRTPVHTSPNLTEKRRVRISEDRTLAQQIHKDQQVAAKRITRRSQTAATANRPFCCYVDCKQDISPTQSDALTCTATQHPMHATCAAPPQANSTHRFCRSCNLSTAPTQQC